MRTLIQVELDTATSNKLFADGRLGEIVEHSIGALKPEAAYFFPRGGHRSFIMVVDLADEAAVVPAVEPFWNEMNAKVELFPCMSADDLKAGMSRLAAAP